MVDWSKAPEWAVSVGFCNTTGNWYWIGQRNYAGVLGSGDVRKLGERYGLSRSDFTNLSFRPVNWQEMSADVAAVAYTPDGRVFMLPFNFSANEVYRNHGDATAIIERPAATSTPDWSKCKPNIATHYGTVLNMTGFWHINGDDVRFSANGDGWVELKFQGDRTKLLEGLTPRPDGVTQMPAANKYDRVIHGKYGTGQCIVDVYRVLNAFGPLSPEIDHSIKKLLAAGQRGHKDEKQDLLEAIQSIEARLRYLEAVNG